MNTPDSFDFIELQFAAEDVSTAADEAPLIADAALREDIAKQDTLIADTNVDRLAAELALQRACLDQVAAMATSSLVNWELRRILDSDS